MSLAVSMARDEDDRPAYYIAQMQDIAVARAARQSLAHRALHDPLTGLANRDLLMDRLSHALSRSARTGVPTVVLFCDLDHFKAVNDELGHEVGDLVLVTIADRLRQVIRPSDTVARLGGDEFVVVVEGLVGWNEQRASPNGCATISTSRSWCLARRCGPAPASASRCRVPRTTRGPCCARRTRRCIARRPAAAAASRSARTARCRTSALSGRDRLGASERDDPGRQGGRGRDPGGPDDAGGALREHGVVPGLGTVLVGDDPGSRSYVAGKHRDCAQVGITSLQRELPADASQADVEAVVDELNADPACTGYIVQLPLPAGLDAGAALTRMDPAKDADGLHPTNLGRLVLGEPGPLPCTPRGIVAAAAALRRAAGRRATSWSSVAG